MQMRAQPSRPKSELTLKGVPKKVPPSSEFGRRLTDLRTARGLTQIQLAQLIDSTQRCISRYETVAEMPPAASIVRLAEVLEVSTDELLGFEKPKAKKSKEDPETRRLWKRFQQLLELPEKDRRAVIRLLNSLHSASKSRRSAA